MAATCEDSSLAELTAAPYASYWEAYDKLTCLEAHFLGHGDRRAIFASVYALTTRRVAESIDQGEYTNTAWMKAYQTEFANHYRRALHSYAIGQRNQVPSAWLLAFDQAATGQTLIIQDVLLGMNAHTNFDLAFAIEAVKLSPNTASRFADHTRVNDALAEVSAEVMDALGSLYGASNYALLGSALGPIDDILVAGGMAAARQNAWNNAALLSATSFWNRWIVTGSINAQAMTAGALIVSLTLTPALRNALRAAEGSDPGSTFCQHFNCSN
jgi:hypothetical protein